jgi:hypothetical protein
MVLNRNEEDVMQLKDVKQGEFIRFYPDSNKTYIRKEYDQSTKKYAVQDFDDINRYRYLKGSTEVHVGFTF